jgi:hypothetical protein
MKAIIDRHADRLQDSEQSEREPADPAEYEFTEYELFQLKRYGNIIPNRENTPDDEQYENGILELNRLADFIESQSETNLLNYSL